MLPAMLQHAPRCFSSSHGSSRNNMYCPMPYKCSPTGWCAGIQDLYDDWHVGDPMDIIMYVLPPQDDGGRTSDPCSRSRVYQA